jgi:hypothetical protein
MYRSADPSVKPVASRYTDYAVFLLPMLKSELTATSYQETNDYGVPASRRGDSIRDLDAGKCTVSFTPLPTFRLRGKNP